MKKNCVQWMKISQVATIIAIVLFGAMLNAQDKPKNLISNGSFELGLHNDWAHPFYSKAPLSLTDSTVATHGKRSFCMELPRMHGRKHLLLIYKPFKVDPKAEYNLSFDIKADQEGIKFGKTKIGTEWTRISLPAKIKNGVLQAAINVFGKDQKVWIDSVSLTKGKSKKPVPFKPAGPVELAIGTEIPGNCFKEKEPVVLHLYGVSYDKNEKVTPNLSVYDYYDKKIWSKDVPMNLKKGELVDISITLPFKKFGSFRVELREQANGPVVGEKNITRMRDYLSPEYRKASPACGHYGNHNADLLQQAARLGIPINRLHDGGSSAFLWRNLEPKKGEWNFKEADKAVAEHQKYGIDILGILAAAPDWATGPPNLDAWPGKLPGRDHLDDWANYVYTIVKRYKGKVKYWEVWNEPYGLPAEFYFELTKKAYEAAKKAWSEVQIVAPCGARGHYWWMEKLNRLGILKYCDIYSHHAYGVGASGAAGMAELGRVDGKKRPIWDTESSASWGSRTFYKHMNENPPGKVAPQSTTDNVVRLLVGLYAGGTDRQFYYWNYSTYYWKGVCASQGTSFEYDGSVKPFGMAHALAGVMLAGLKPAGTINLGGARTAYLFKGDNLCRVVIWDNHLRGKQDELATFDPNWTTGELRELFDKLGKEKRYQKQMSFLTCVLPKDARVDDVMTNPVPLPVEKGKKVIPVTSSPIYITLPNMTEEKVKELFANCEVRNIGYPDIGMRCLLGGNIKIGKPEMILCVINETNKKYPVKLSLADLKGVKLDKMEENIELKPFEAKNVSFPIADPNALADKISGKYKIEIKGQKPIEGEFSKYVMISREFKKPPVIDGKLNDWDLSNWKCIEMDTSYLKNKEKICSKEDISAQAWAGWDDKYFYLAVKVKDDKYFPAHGLPSGFWNQDSVELFFDLDVLGDGGENCMSLDDFQILTVSGTKDKPMQPAYAPAESFPGMKIGTSRYDGGYIMEYAFPYSSIKPVQGKAGTVFGLDFGIDDADVFNKQKKRPYRKLQMQWATREWAIWKDPSKYGMVVFTK